MDESLAAQVQGTHHRLDRIENILRENFAVVIQQGHEQQHSMRRLMDQFISQASHIQTLARKNTSSRHVASMCAGAALTILLFWIVRSI